MIIEAFAKYLHSADPAVPASSILARWLWERLTMPPECNADKVLRCEVRVEVAKNAGKNTERNSIKLPAPEPGYTFSASSESGRRLLKSLYDYASSYEQQKWSRWVHRVKASDFNQMYNKD